ncbi:SH3 domain-containing protein [Aureimonas altamirensis]|uniref:SH3 domain-containing protein n=1 Tax=Aureimonas altamirensis TaxID=370622 RepID=UPI002037009E|nr:SH3 domain-containing protein [Aureimonas altamirensis]MCM2503080.1 SH3 domain-containing protein [Aureimonas altamirensis]
MRLGWLNHRVPRHIAALAICSLAVAQPDAWAASKDSRGEGMHAGALGRVTGLPLPRYVSIGGAPARMRVGPGTDYPIRWVYHHRGTPVEIIEEWGNWRRIRDADAATGWMYAPLLSGRRTAIVAPWDSDGIALHRRPATAASTIATLGPRVLLDVANCSGSWCRVSLPPGELEGHVRQSALWGVYPGERVR